MTDWSNFVADEWRWGLTWGWYQLALGLLCSTSIFMSMRRSKSLPALILVIVSYWSAFIVYLVCMFLLSIYMIGYAQVPVHTISSSAVILCCGIFFSLLQAFFLHMAHEWYRVKLQCALWVTLLGNSIAAIIAFIVTHAVHSRYAIDFIASFQQSIV
ncbi:MAG TPA: hypothetical protein VL201_02635 [Patescibacteria group bacterium]|jgi:hypothetical protein|nr:hypothetical protein [Patescibacteria group bacterium]